MYIIRAYKIKGDKKLYVVNHSIRIITTIVCMYITMQASEAIKFGADLVHSTPPTNGICEINHVCGNEPHIFHTSIPALQAHCSNGGWTVILRRKADVSQQVNFTRTWNDYKYGFGDLNTEFWYGLRNIHCLTSRQQVDLSIELKYANGMEHTYTYEHFRVDGPEDKFTLHIGQLQQPSPGRDNMAYHNGQRFSTYDKDNDSWVYNCALDASQGKGGGWWFGSCRHSVLTRPHPSIFWYTAGTINYVEMKVRPKHCAL